MAKKAPENDPVQDVPEVTPPPQAAAGLPAVAHAVRVAQRQMGAKRSLLTLLNVNQEDGFDCPGCAWPEPDHRHRAEFCENGAKAVAEEATRRRVTPEFFARHPVSELARRSSYWLGQQGRLTQPMLLDRSAGASGGSSPAAQPAVDRSTGTAATAERQSAGSGDSARDGDPSDHYVPISWEHAFDIIAEEFAALDSPDEAVFYTSGRTSNEAAFLYQLLARRLGTNNLPDCSNMCHESSGFALGETLGVGKGSVSLEDVYRADLIIVAGQNPGTNHPRMLSALERAKAGGTRIITVNPLPEVGMERFNNPQTARGLIARGTPLTDLFLQVRLGGDQALFRAWNRMLVEQQDALDTEFIAAHTHGFEEFAALARQADWDQIQQATGLDRAQIEQALDMITGAQRIVVCWAMGLTQHKHAVVTIKEIVNFLLLRGNIGKPGAGVCPVRGHSNVQGDRTMGIVERPTTAFLDALEKEFGFTPPRHHGHDTVSAIRAMRDGRARVFLAMGGNFAAASPDTEVTEAALRRCRLTVQVSTKLNRSHMVPGTRALILPVLGRTERDVQASGEQFVTVEDSMSVVHASRGKLSPASEHLLSEPSLICRLAQRVFTDDERVPWARFNDDYDRIRDSIARVIPGFDGMGAKVRQPGGFTLPHPPRDSRAFPTSTGKANFTPAPVEYPMVPKGRLLLQTLRSHDQFNTTIYGLDDRYRGIRGGRRVVLVNPEDAAERSLPDGCYVDLISEWTDGTRRRAPGFRVVHYPTARGCAAAYYPETNVLVPLDATAEGSNTPASKSVVVALEPTQTGPDRKDGTMSHQPTRAEEPVETS